MEVKAGYKLTQVGVIPEDWEAVTIGDVATFSGGSQPPRSTFRFASKQGYIRLIQIRDYKTDEYATFIPELMARKRCTAEDIMIGRYGPPIFQILRGIEGAYNVALLKAIPSERIHREFFFNVLKQEKLFQLIDSRSQRSSGQTGVEMPALKGYRLSLPPFPEQRSIATVLSDMDALLRSLDQLIAKKRDLKQATMQQLLTGKKRLPGFDGEWEVKRLGDITEIVMGQSPSSSNYNTKRIGLPLIQGNADIDNRKTIKRIFTTQITKRGRSGDILMSVRAPVGEISRALFDICLGRGVCAIRHDNDFIYHCLINLEPNWTKHSKGSTFESVNSADVKALEVNLPKDSDEQTAIATVLSDMDTELAALQQRRDKTRALKQGMMQELLTGRTRLL